MGREFVSLFDNWAEDYDRTVSGDDQEYQAVFLHYDEILQAVVNQVKGTVLEFGVGTGNLTEKLLQAHHDVIGVEPSEAMRKKARMKLPQATIVNGDFLNFSQPERLIETIASTYAFHHLTDNEKQRACYQFNQQLPIGGRVVFADTVFASSQVKEETIKRAEQQLFYNLAEDLRTEHYPLLSTINTIFIEAGFDISSKQMNDFVWLLVAEKKREVKGDE
ncbi:class I SAM-dependent DNA methyltransferase [Amphibacillus cookii]|uniref:class I SAM-dependent DNA methyltransferase n=1 Tax=Amphibacillus cookii TaxID=767787 RepID=UPI001956B8E8|nr:class I SAM-dependent methyltransferase [Amphibacillus cookii]MBM7540955.1 putative AdoMet-dependent methyltransferase [Amphibacillus cookii]